MSNILYDVLFKNAHLCLEEGIQYGALAVKDGRVAALFSPGSEPEPTEAGQVVDVGGKYLLPGGVDPHVHIRYPGGKLRETFVSGSQAAAAGGCTTIIEHPISTPPQYSPETLKRRVEAAEQECLVDIVFYGAAGAEHLHQIKPLAAAGICAFKTFLHAAPEGRAQEFVGLTAKNNFELYQVMREVAETGLLMAAHTEDNDLVQGGIAALRAAGNTAPIAHCLSRPALAEVLAVQRLLAIAKETKTRVYLVHISAPESMELARAARAQGLEVYVETCPHYLYMTDADVARHGAYCKCNPALRSREMVDALWQYVSDGTVDTIGSDHAPYLVAEKENHKEDIFVAPAGFPGLETRLGYMLKAAHEGRISLGRAIELLSTNPAKIFGLYPQKGSLRLGADADLVLLDPARPYQLRAEDLVTMARDVCHFMDGITLYGPVEQTYVRGSLVYDRGHFPAAPGSGRWIRLNNSREGRS